VLRSNTKEGSREAIGQSEAFLEFQERLSRVAPVNRPVLLLGERGTGKELAAFRLHYLSGRWQGPFVTINCAALPPTLIESELFGYEKGAFTGAAARRTGRFEAADGGSLFLDEIGHIPLEVQEKILRVVEYNTIERIGSIESVSVDVRLIAATNADLPVRVAAGEFMRDLLDRLSFEVLFLPPLRRRGDDILLLAHHFAARMSFELGREDIPQFSENAVRALVNYRWPGNIRELKNVVERAVYRSDTKRIADIAFDPFRSPYERTREPEQPQGTPPAAEPPPDGPSYREAVRQFQLRLIAKALQDTKYSQKAAAARLGLTYHQFRGLYRKFAAELRRL
jgi:psp operon transcriptional activator